MKAPSEKHLEDWIVDNPQYFGEAYGSQWDEDELYPYFEKVLKRQARFPSGIADLVMSNDTTICAVELKLGGIDGEAVAQVQRYMYMLRLIYQEAFDIARRGYPDVSKHYHYPDTVSPDMGMHVVRGMVVGHGVKDHKLLMISELLGIELVTYDYNPKDDTYRFETQSTVMISRETIDARDDFASGIIGQELVNIILRRTDEILGRRK